MTSNIYGEKRLLIKNLWTKTNISSLMTSYNIGVAFAFNSVYQVASFYEKNGNYVELIALKELISAEWFAS